MLLTTTYRYRFKITRITYKGDLHIINDFKSIRVPRFEKKVKKKLCFLSFIVYEFYGILEWENNFGFVLGCKSTLLKHREIYKGNSEKYKGKIRNQDILIVGPKNNFVECVR